MRLYVIKPKDRSMTRQQWRELDRRLRISAREQQKAAMDMMTFGYSVTEISPEGPRCLSTQEIGQLNFRD